MEEVLDIKAAAELLGNDSELLKELLDAFVNDKKLSLEQLQALELKQDTEEAAKYVHYYKGAGRQLCARKMAASGQKLEDVLRKRTTGNLEELNRIFLEDYNEALEAIQEAADLI